MTTNWIKYNPEDPECLKILHLHDYFFVVWKDDRYEDGCDMGLLSWNDGFYRPELAGDEDKYLYHKSVICFVPVKFPDFTPEIFLGMMKQPDLYRYKGKIIC